MTDQRIRDLTAATSLAVGDIAEWTKDPSGSPLSRKATGQLVADMVVGGTAALTAVDKADVLPIGDTSASGVAKTATVEDVLKGGIGSLIEVSAAVGDHVVILDANFSDAPKKATVGTVLGAFNDGSTPTLPSDPRIAMIGDAGAPITMVPEAMLKDIDNWSAFSGTIDGAADKLVLFDDSAGTVHSVTPNKLAAGKQTVFVPAAAMISRTTNGAADGSTELSTNKVMLKTKDFDTSTKEYVQFVVGLPKSYDLGTVTFRPWWTAASGSGGVAWSLAGRAASNDDALDQAMGSAITVTDTLITANDLHDAGESAAVTIAGTPAALDFHVFELAREVANGSDTLGVDAKLLGIHLYFSTAARDDS